MNYVKHYRLWAFRIHEFISRWHNECDVVFTQRPRMVESSSRSVSGNSDALSMQSIEHRVLASVLLDHHAYIVRLDWSGGILYTTRPHRTVLRSYPTSNRRCLYLWWKRSCRYDMTKSHLKRKIIILRLFDCKHL